MTQVKAKAPKQGLLNIHLTSTISMSLVLFLIGMVFLLLLVAHDTSTYVKENINLSVILEDGVGKQDVKRIENFLTESSFAKSVDYISKADALKDHIANLGENPQDFLGYNPLKASIEVKLHAAYANNDSVTEIEAKLKPFPHINRIIYQKDMVSLVNDNVKKISFILLGLAVVLLFVSIALINNTIRLSLYSNRFLINTMKLVGATPWFIRKPYLMRSMLNGLIAALISILLLGGVVYFVQYEFGISGMMFYSLNFLFVAFIVILSGVFLSAVSSYFAVGKYLRMHSNEMFSM
ncbi:MAG: permease-like cell division protein FtsX [Paludibacter sp.]|nr:permease-like cell division protein FtsX [Paludibacter sp.]